MNNPLKKIELDNKKALLVILAALVVVYLDYSFVIKMQLQGLRNAGPNIQKLKSDLSGLSAQLARMQEEKARLMQEKKQVDAKAKKFIAQEQVPSLLEEIAETAKESGVELIQMKPLRDRPPRTAQKDAAAPKFYPFSIGLSLSCGYHQLGRFLNGLESNKIFISAEELSISPLRDDYFKHKVELVLRTYAEKKP